MLPPVALGAVPVVEAEIVPPFWIVSVCAEIFVLPPAPVPSVLVEIALPAPSISTELAGLERPWLIVMLPAFAGRRCWRKSCCRWLSSQTDRQ